jgi:hypothetical protein
MYLPGTPDPDEINGLQGNDTITALAGNDLSTERQQFAFAKIGAAPTDRDVGKRWSSCSNSMKRWGRNVLQPPSA